MAIYPFYATGHPFSNFTKCRFTVDGTEFNCGEQWIMYAKANLFNDLNVGQQILRTAAPAAIKKLGRQVKNFDEEIWKANRVSLVKKGLLEKFRQNKIARDMLLGTGEEIIVEASPTDKIWGVSLGMNNPNVHDMSKWKGLNLLGRVLMEIREELQPFR